jgi:single-strand DNA-binding protein
MSGETTITVVGNLTNDPELRFTPGSREFGKTEGTSVVNFTIASTPRVFDSASQKWRDGDTLFLRATAWREMAEHAAASLAKGSRVVATGVLKPRTYETKAGEKRTVLELEVEEIGLSLKYTAIPSEPKKIESTKSEAPSDVDTEAVAEAGAGHMDRRKREFTISPRLYANEDVWFGKYANPSGTITTGAAEDEPAF